MGGWENEYFKKFQAFLIHAESHREAIIFVENVFRYEHWEVLLFPI